MATAGTGRQTVTTAGTRVQLGAAGSWTTGTGVISSIAITALSTNTGVIVVGDVACVAAAGTRRGTPLSANQTASFPVDDVADLYMDSTVNGEGISATWVAP